ncbi:MAG: hypothetical protein AAFV37_14320 [Pseudomonadota bacterium]
MAVNIHKGEIGISPYDDGSGYVATVTFVAERGEEPRVTIEQGYDSSVWLSLGDVMPLIAALSRAHEELAGLTRTDAGGGEDG